MAIGKIWSFCDLAAFLFAIYQETLNIKTGHLFVLVTYFYLESHIKVMLK